MLYMYTIGMPKKEHVFSPALLRIILRMSRYFGFILATHNLNLTVSNRCILTWLSQITFLFLLARLRKI